MNQGSLAERFLTRSVIKHIKKQNKSIVNGATVGSDYSNMNGVITADAVADTPEIAWTKAMNNFACSGGVCEGARFTLLLPEEIKESKIKEFMAKFNSFAQTAKVQVLGGHSQVSNAFTRPQFCVNLIGSAGKFTAKKKNVEVGYDIIMTKGVGVMGTDLIVEAKFDELTKRFAKSYIEGALYGADNYSVVKEANILASSENTLYMHDVSFGGIYGALWQLGKWMDKGFLIDHSNFTLRQETIEICEFFNINPYMLEGTGALLAIVKDGEQAVAELEENGIKASVIGKVAEGNERMVIVNEIDRRCLAPIERDEIFSVFA